MMDKNICLNENQLKMLVKNLAMEIFNNSIEIPIEVSNRLTSTFGYFMIIGRGSKARASKLTFAGRLINGDYKLSTIVDVIKHELTHYTLFVNGSDSFRDGDREFENELRRIGAHPTKTLSNSGQYHIAKCSCCGLVTSKGTEKKVKSRCNTSKWVSKCCRSAITYGGVGYIQDKSNERMALETYYRMENLESVKKILNVKGYDITKQLISTVATVEKRKAASTPAPITSDITNVIIPGPKGVTRSQVHPAMVAAIDVKDEQKLKIIKQTYPDFFSQVLKHISKSRLSYIESLSI